MLASHASADGSSAMIRRSDDSACGPFLRHWLNRAPVHDQDVSSFDQSDALSHWRPNAITKAVQCAAERHVLSDAHDPWAAYVAQLRPR